MDLVKGLVYTYDLVSFPFYFVTQRPWVARRRAKQQRAAQVNPGDPYSAWLRVGKPPATAVDGLKTLDQLFRSACAAHSGKPCLGVRPVLMVDLVHDDQGRMQVKRTLGDTYQWLSYEQTEQRVDQLARGLLASGVCAGHKVALLLDTRLEWMLSAQALFRLGATLVTIYSTLGEEGIRHAVNEVQAAHLITSAHLWAKLKAGDARASYPQLRHVVLVADGDEGVMTTSTTNASAPSGDTTLTVESFAQLEAKGKTAAGSELNAGQRPGPEDLAMIMYTSGTSGLPKGVMLTHRSVVSAVRQAAAYLGDLRLSPATALAAYLPLAHMLEFAVESLFLVSGLRIGYSGPGTLTSSSSGLQAGCKGDAELLGPQAVASVPMVLDKMRKQITEKVEGQSRGKKKLVAFAMEYKNYWHQKGYRTPLVNRLLCKPIRASLGGRVRFLFVGGAPLSGDTQLFTQTCLDARVLQGYGATETCGMGTAMDAQDLATGRCGAPYFGTKIRLVDWPEGGYRATDKPRPRGEILIGGDTVALGYFKRDAETEAAFREEKGTRWFYTGDIGEVHPDGTLQIVDRKKDLVKLSFGEYISLGKIEAELKSNSYVDNICVVADQGSNFLVALVAPARGAVTQLGRHLAIEGLPLDQLAGDPEVMAEVLKSLNEHGLRAGLSKAELPRKLKLVKEEWSPDSGLVTAAFKIRRHQIAHFYRADINRMFGISATAAKLDLNDNAVQVVKVDLVAASEAATVAAGKETRSDSTTSADDYVDAQTTPTITATMTDSGMSNDDDVPEVTGSLEIPMVATRKGDASGPQRARRGGNSASSSSLSSSSSSSSSEDDDRVEQSSL